MLTLGSILFICMSLMLGAISYLLYGSYKNSQNQAVRSLFFTFISIFIYSLFLNLVSFIGGRGGIVLIIAYNLSVLAGFVAMYFGLRLPIFHVCPKIESNIKPISWTTIIILLVIMVAQVLDPRLPIVSENGVVFWNATPVAVWLTSAFILIYTIVWAYVAYSNTKILQDFSLRVKMYVLAVNIAIIGISAFFFFPSNNELQSLVSFAITVPAYLATIGVFLYQRKRRVQQV